MNTLDTTKGGQLAGALACFFFAALVYMTAAAGAPTDFTTKGEIVYVTRTFVDGRAH